MNSRPVITNRRAHVRLKCRAKRQVPANAKSHRPNFPARHLRMFCEPIQPRPAIRVKIRNWSLRRIRKPPRPPRVVECNCRPGRLKPPGNLRRGCNKSIPRQPNASPQHRRRQLKNIRVAPDPRILSLRLRRRHKRPHRRSCQRNIRIFRSDNHFFPRAKFSSTPALQSTRRTSLFSQRTLRYLCVLRVKSLSPKIRQCSSVRNNFFAFKRPFPDISTPLPRYPTLGGSCETCGHHRRRHRRTHHPSPCAKLVLTWTSTNAPRN